MTRRGSEWSQMYYYITEKTLLSENIIIILLHFNKQVKHANVSRKSYLAVGRTILPTFNLIESSQTQIIKM